MTANLDTCRHLTSSPSILPLLLAAGLHVDLNGDGVPEYVVASGACNRLLLLLCACCGTGGVAFRGAGVPHVIALSPHVEEASVLRLAARTAQAFSTTGQFTARPPMIPAGGDLEDALDEGAFNVGHERGRFCWMSGALLT